MLLMIKELGKRRYDYQYLPYALPSNLGVACKDQKFLRTSSSLRLDSKEQWLCRFGIDLCHSLEGLCVH